MLRSHWKAVAANHGSDLDLAVRDGVIVVKVLCNLVRRRTHVASASRNNALAQVGVAHGHGVDEVVRETVDFDGVENLVTQREKRIPASRFSKRRNREAVSEVGIRRLSVLRAQDQTVNLSPRLGSFNIEINADEVGRLIRLDELEEAGVA